MKHLRQLTWLLLLVWQSTWFATTAQNKTGEYELLMERIRADVATNPNIESYLPLFDMNTGAFTDIDYGKRDRTNWEPYIHTERLCDMAFAYTNPDNKHYADERIQAMIVKGLDYWYDRNPHCNNWWYNQIAEPQTLGMLLVQMRIGKKQIPQEVEDKTLQRMIEEGGDPAKWTGANRADIALHWIYRACLQQNEGDLQFALDNVYSPVVYTTEEGFQHDNSYFQHGQEL